MSNIVKNTTLPNLLDLLSPHSCRGCGRIGNVLCDCCKKDIINNHIDFCPFCKTTISGCTCQNRHALPPIRIVAWRSSLTGKLVQDLKYHSTRSIARPLAEILSHTLPPINSQLIIVPLPTIAKHIRKRGLDHTLLIAKHLAKLRPNTEVSRLLIRENSATQVGSSRKKRLEQAKNAYKINSKIPINRTATYLLLDDVWTTGASMQAATKTLQKHQIRNICIAILALSS